MFDDYLLREDEITDEEYEAWCRETAIREGLRGRAVERSVRRDMFLARKHDRAMIRLNEVVLKQEQDKWDAGMLDDRMARRTLIRCRE